jgi:DNA repair protein RadC
MNVNKGKKKIESVRVKLVRESIEWYENNIVKSPESCAKIINQYLEGSDREQFIVLGLDTKNKVNFIETVSIGTVNSSIVHPREVFKSLVVGNATSFIVAHNHPSGDCAPSQEDIRVTERLKQVGELVGIQLLDSLIVPGDIASNSYLSLKEKGYL